MSFLKIPWTIIHYRQPYYYHRMNVNFGEENKIKYKYKYKYIFVLYLCLILLISQNLWVMLHYTFFLKFWGEELWPPDHDQNMTTVKRWLWIKWGKKFYPLNCGGHVHNKIHGLCSHRVTPQFCATKVTQKT
jgi:hypothetical protein